MYESNAMCCEVERWKKSLEAEDSTSRLVSSDKIKSASSSWSMQPVSIVLKDLFMFFDFFVESRFMFDPSFFWWIM